MSDSESEKVYQNEPTPSCKGSAKIRPIFPDPKVWGFTISPPHRGYSIPFLIYQDLYMFQELIKKGIMIVYPEFAKGIRLHYHIEVFYDNLTDTERQELYRLLTWLHCEDRKPKLMWNIKAVNKQNNNKRILYKYYCQYYMNPFTEYSAWHKYCTEESYFTQSILGFPVITYDILNKLRIQSETKYRFMKTMEWRKLDI